MKILSFPGSPPSLSSSMQLFFYRVASKNDHRGPPRGVSCSYIDLIACLKRWDDKNQYSYFDELLHLSPFLPN